MNRESLGKSLLSLVLVGWIFAATGSIAKAQSSLSKDLLAEDPQMLAREAREKGDSVRGAILYSQKKFNCAGCHRQGATDLLGPDLTQVAGDVPDAFFVESILQPSKEIKKGFETVNVLTVGGQIIVGRIVREDDQTLTLRDTSPGNRLIQLPRGAIEARKANVTSSMPDGLADQLSNRQEFLDLVKYLMDIAATGTPASLHPTSGREQVAARVRGLALLDQFQCTSCHRGQIHDLFPRKQAPDLASSTARIDPHYIRRFIADPLHVKPGTSMPDVMAAKGDRDKQLAAEAITHHLISLTSKKFVPTEIDLESAARGSELFHRVGCVACHSPRDEDGRELVLKNSVPLGPLDEKYSTEGLTSFLEDPHSVRPSGRMPNMVLSHWEAADLANYLLSTSAGTESSEGSQLRLPLDRSLAEVGKRKFNELGCARCHAQEVGDEPSTYPPLENLRIDQGCLSTETGAWPKYQLDQSQREAIRTALASHRDPLTDPEKITVTMETFRCFACHTRDELGGVSDERNDYFHSENENLGPQGRMPPTLTGVGAKLKPKWMREVLVRGRAIRPYMSTRMPQYGSEQVAHLVDLVAQVDQNPEVSFGHIDDPKEARKVGTELVGSGGLNCVACHTFQQRPAQTMPAVDLTEMAERLQKEWFYRYMKSPQSLSPGTVMPSFWPGGRAIRTEILDGRTDQQIEAIWLWMLEGRQARMPRGVVFEPIEILATHEAVMLRRSYPGIGKRGIGVGYPEGMNLAFDAEQMRIALVWKGKFADPGGVWRGQGSGNVRPLGTDLIRFEQGPELGRTPWSAVEENSRPATHQFTGYFLDPQQRPTFTYRFEDIDVQDFSAAVNDDPDNGPGLKRRLVFNAEHSRDGLFFRVVKQDRIKRVDDHTFVMDDPKLTVRIDRPHVGEVIQKPTGTFLVVPLTIPTGKSELRINYAW